jgi:hypothetical protein
MALDPRIALGYQPPQIQPPDYLRTMLAAAQMQQQQMQQMQMLQAMQRQQREAREDEAMDAYLKQGGSSLADLGRKEGPPTQTSLSADATAPQESQASSSRIDPRDMLQRFGRRALPVVAGIRQLDMAEMQAEQMKMETELKPEKMRMETEKLRMETELKRVEYMGDILDTVVDQPSLDAAHQELSKVAPQMAESLPQVYDKADMDRRRQAYVLRKQRLQRSPVGMQPIHGTIDGKPAVAQLTDKNEAQITQFPQGFVPTPPSTKWIDTGLEQIPTRAGEPVGRPIPKLPGEVKRQEQEGQEIGKITGQRPEVARQQQEALAQLEEKYQTVMGAIGRAELRAKTKEGTLPATGFGTSALGAALPGTNAGLVANELRTIKNNMGLEAMISLKEAGGSLTPVTDTDIKILQGILGDLDRAQAAGGAALTSKLAELKQYWDVLLQRGRDKYKTDFEQYRPAPEAKPLPSPYGHMDPQKMTPAQRAAEKAWLQEYLKKQPGGSP